MTSQIMQYGLILTIFLVGINATLIVGAGLILTNSDSDVDFSSTTLISSDYGINDPNAVNPNEVIEYTVESGEETNQLLPSISDLISAIPFVGDAVGWVGEIKNLVVSLLFGYIMLLSLIGLPPAIQFIIAAILFPIQIISILWLIFTVVSSIRGGSI